MRVVITLFIICTLVYYVLKDMGVVIALNGWAIAFFALLILIVGLVISFMADFRGWRK
jgi:predicted MFS family arabinose efflux permease